MLGLLVHNNGLVIYILSLLNAGSPATLSGCQQHCAIAIRLSPGPDNDADLLSISLL